MSLDFWVRATVILAFSSILRLFFRSGRARSSIGHAALIGLVLLPAVSLAPRLSIPVLASESAPIPVPFEPSPPTFEPLPEPIFAPISPSPVTLIPETPIPPPPIVINWPLSIYLIITFFLLLRLILSLIASIRLCRAGTLVDDPIWLDALDNARNRLKLSARVSLRRSHRIAIPVVIGWPRATILLPTNLADSVADAVLLHELAHVRRSDFAWNLLLRVVRAFYWPHPLVWLLSRSISVDRERACDALCIHELGGPPAYRAALLSVASGLIRRPSTSIGIAMARTPRLALRLSWIDRHPGDPRCVLGLRGRISLALTTLLLVGLIGTGEVTRAQARILPQALVEPAKPADGRVFHLQVVDDATGKPISKADVHVWVGLVEKDFRTTDEQGRLEIRHSTGLDDRRVGIDVWADGFAQQRHNWFPADPAAIPEGAVTRLKAGESLGGIVKDRRGQPIAGAEVLLWSHNYKKKDSHELLYDLRAVTGPDGRWHTGGAPETTGKILGFRLAHPDYLADQRYRTSDASPPIEEFRAGTAELVMEDGIPISGRVLDADGRAVAGASVLWVATSPDILPGMEGGKTTTDADGRFRFPHVADGKTIYLLSQAKGHGPGELTVEEDRLANPAEIRLGRPRHLSGLVVDPGGKPVADADVVPDQWHRFRCLAPHRIHTDLDGRFRWDDAPEDGFQINVSKFGYVGIHWENVPASVPEVTFTLHPGLQVVAKVREPSGNRINNDVEIEVGAVDPATGAVATWDVLDPEANQAFFRNGSLRANFATPAAGYRLRLRVPGFEPFVSRILKADEKEIDLGEIRLTKAGGIVPTAQVLRPDGKPLAGARVLRAGTNFFITMTDGQWSDKNTGEQTTGPDGSFAIPDVAEPFVILVLGDDVFALTNSELLAASTKVQAQPYGRVEGEFRVGDKPLANRPIELFGNRLTDAVTLRVPFLFSQTVNTDPNGHFVFDRIIPMDFFRIGRHDPSRTPERVWTRGEAVDVRPGETTRVVLGGKGRAIVGRLARPDGVAFGVGTSVALIGDSPMPPAARIFPGKVPTSPEDWRQWLDAYRRSPEVRAHIRSQIGIHVGVRPDGSFRIDDAPEGHYRLVARLEDSPPNRPDSDPFACIAREVFVPPVHGGPIDLGTLTFRPHVAVRVGEPAPPLDVTTVDGRRISLADLRGKFVLLDFGAHYDVAVQNEVAQMHGVFEAFGKDDRLAIMSLVCESDTPAARRFVASKQEPWPQAIIGPLPNPLADSFGVEPRDDTASAFILVGPDGRIVARPEIGNGPQHDDVNKAVAKALGK